jgi:glycosyltransferase involved in cell wall biosynthesis
VIAAPLGSSAISEYFLALGSALESRGAEVWFVTPRPERVSECPERGARLASWPSSRPTRLRDARFLLRLARAVRPDCVISNFAAVNVVTLVGWVLRVPDRICWYRTMTAAIDLDSPSCRLRLEVLRLRKRLVFKLATRLVAPSTAAAHDLSTGFGVDRSRIEVWPNAIEDPIASQVVESVPVDERSGIVCVGALTSTKGQAVLIAALARLRALGEPVQAVFVGEGPNRRELEELAERLGIRSGCTFLGWLDRAQVLGQMSRALATVVPSRSEAFGVVAIESMAVGTPVVASRVDGLQDVVNDEVGMLFDVDDVEQLARHVRVLAGDARLRERLGSSARRRFLQRYERDAAVADLAEHLLGRSP